MRLIYTPAIPKRYAESVAQHAGVAIAPYEHQRFACGELFSAPTKSLRGQRVGVLGTFNPHTASRDAVRLQIILDGLKRMEIKGIDLIIPYFPQPIELMPLYTWADTITSLDLPASAYLRDEQMQQINRPLIDCLKSNVTRIYGRPIADIKTAGLFANYFVDKMSDQRFAVLGLKGLFPGGEIKRSISQLADLEFSFPQMELIRKGKKVAGAKLFGDVSGKRVLMQTREIRSSELLRRVVGTLAEHKAKEIVIGISHAVFSEPVRKEIGNNDAISKVVTTDTTGVPGENYLREEGKEIEARQSVPEKIVVLSTAELVGRAIAELAIIATGKIFKEGKK